MNFIPADSYVRYRDDTARYSMDQIQEWLCQLQDSSNSCLGAMEEGWVSSAAINDGSAFYRYSNYAAKLHTSSDSYKDSSAGIQTFLPAKGLSDSYFLTTTGTSQTAMEWFCQLQGRLCWIKRTPVRPGPVSYRNNFASYRRRSTRLRRQLCQLQRYSNSTSYWDGCTS